MSLHVSGFISVCKKPFAADFTFKFQAQFTIFELVKLYVLIETSPGLKTCRANVTQVPAHHPVKDLKGSFRYPLAREGVYAPGGPVFLAHAMQKVSYIVGLTANG